MNVEFVEQASLQAKGAVATAVMVYADLDLTADARSFDASGNGALTRGARDRRFDGAVDQLCELGARLGDEVERLLLVGLGSRVQLDKLGIEAASARARAAAENSNATTLEIRMSDFTADQAAHAALGALLSDYRFDRYRTPKHPAKPRIELVRIVTNNPAAARDAMVPLTALAEGIHLARDLVFEPPNILHPEAFAERVRQLGEMGLAVTVLGEIEMRALGMGALLGVGQGSRRESKLVLCEWRGASDPLAAPVAFVGKGVTFDSGGLSIKPAKDMECMKYDMGGAASVVGLMLTLALRKAAINAVGVLGLAENMPDGDALRPSDVLTSMSGQTIEVINTDAEGRLVLADALWYAQMHFKPKALLDLATLTGNVSYALGNDYAAVLANDDTLADALLAASKSEGESLWRLPLVAAYDKLHDTPVADMKNVGGHPEAGTITAALFLQRFVRDIPWAHLDIASVAWRTRSDKPTVPEGATGYGVRLLNRLVADLYEEKSA